MAPSNQIWKSKPFSRLLALACSWRKAALTLKPLSPKSLPLIVRKVQGASMFPTYQSDSIVWGTGMFRRLVVGDVVILEQGGLEKIKRIEALVDDRLFVLGDNPIGSTDSRDFGWLSTESVRAKVFWPRR